MPTTKRSVRFGDPRLPPRFWSKVSESASGCWLWIGGKRLGYGCTSWNGLPVPAHRLSYKALVGPIRAETLDHLCRVPGCVNPRHLEPVSTKENVLRGVGPSAMNARKTHCKRGHLLRGTNLLPHKRKIMWRACATCQKDYRARYFYRTGR